MRHVVLIAGPPGAGKTTRAHTLAEQFDLTVYDRDDERWGSEREFRAALAALGANPSARAVVIRACATSSARRKTASLIAATATELLAVPAEVCRQRITGDTRAYTGQTWTGTPARLAGVTTWWREHAADPWTVPAPTLAPSRNW